MRKLQRLQYRRRHRVTHALHECVNEHLDLLGIVGICLVLHVDTVHSNRIGVAL